MSAHNQDVRARLLTKSVRFEQHNSFMTQIHLLFVIFAAVFVELDRDRLLLRRLFSVFSLSQSVTTDYNVLITKTGHSIIPNSNLSNSCATMAGIKMRAFFFINLKGYKSAEKVSIISLSISIF